jgi:hypothetical protein
LPIAAACEFVQGGQIAEASDLTLAAVRRHIRVAEAWLRREMGAPEITDGS